MINIPQLASIRQNKQKKKLDATVKWNLLSGQLMLPEQVIVVF